MNDVSEDRIPIDAERIERLDPEVARILRGKSGMERLRLAHEAWDLARHRLTAFFQGKHPDWTSEQIRQEVVSRLAR